MPTEMDSLIEMLRSGKKAEAPISPAALRDEWLQAVDHLLEQVREWMKPAIEQGLLEVYVQDLPLNEEELGEYDTHVLQLRTPDGKLVSVVPKQRMVIGAIGRVDVQSWGKRWVLLRKKPGKWAILISHQPRNEEPLNEESFARILREALA